MRRGIFRKLTLTHIFLTLAAINCVHVNGKSLYRLAHGGGGRGDVLQHVKRERNCPGGEMSERNMSEGEMSGSHNVNAHEFQAVSERQQARVVGRLCVACVRSSHVFLRLIRLP